MSDSNSCQTSFLGGEFSPLAQGRSDLPAYRAAMNVCRNGFPIAEGAWCRRSGTKYTSTTKGGLPGRVMSLAFVTNLPYIMEFTDSFLRFYAVATQTQGLTNPLPADFRLVTNNDNKYIVAISAATPALVETVVIHQLATADEVEFLFDSSLSPSYLPTLRNRVFKVVVTDPTHYELYDSVTGDAIDGAAIGWLTPPASTLVSAPVLHLPTPYLNGDWATVRKVQAEKRSILLHGSYIPLALNVTTDPTETSFADFSIDAISFTDGPYLDPPADGSTLTPSALSGPITITASSQASINDGDGFVSTDVGRSIRLLSEPAPWDIITAYVANDSVSYGGAYFTCIQANSSQIPDIAIAYWALNPSAAVWSWGIIQSVSSTTGCVLLIAGVALLYALPVSVWQMGAYSNTTGWPTNGLYYEGRLWLAGAIPNRFDASVVNGIGRTQIDMTPTAIDGTVADDNGISYVLNADDVNPIYWMKGTTTGIVCGTLPREWMIQASQLADPLTPTSIQAHPMTDYGSADMEPVMAELAIVFVQSFKRKAMEYFPEAVSGKYIAPNLSLTAQHLTTSGIEEIRYQQERMPVIWARCGDGSLIGATYNRTSTLSGSAANFAGWHRHDLGSTRTVESIAISPSVDGAIDALAMVTNDAVTGVRQVELMQNLFDVDEDIKNGWFMDGAMVPSGGIIDVDGGLNRFRLYGLWPLTTGRDNGTLFPTVFVGGMRVSIALVINGAITLYENQMSDETANNLFRAGYLESISSDTEYGAYGCKIVHGGVTYTVPVVVGFPFTSQGQILRPDAIEQIKSPTGPGLGKPRRQHQFAALLHNTQKISFGTSFGGTGLQQMHAAIFKSPGGTQALTLLDLFSGIYWGTVDDNYGFDGMICWEISEPYPATVVALNGFMHMQDR